MDAEVSFSSARSKEVNPYRQRLGEFPGRMLFDPRTLPGSVEQEIVRQLVARHAQVFVELGSGSGQHILSLARRWPEAGVFGFEIRHKRAVRTMEKAQREKIENAYVLHCRGESFATLFPPSSVDGLYVNFPDPWEKKRWLKHRMLNYVLLQNLSTVLKPEGFLAVKTDHASYFAAFLQIVSEFQQNHPGKIQVAEKTHDLYNSEFLEHNIATEFEQLFRRQSAAICYLKLLYAGNAAP